MIMGSIDRYCEYEFTSDTFLAEYLKRTMMHLGQLLCQRQPNARTFTGTSRRIVNLIKPVKNKRNMSGRNSNTIVAHLKDDSWFFVYLYHNTSAVRREFKRVRN